MTPKGLRSERETIILFNEEDNEATIWTASGPIDRRLRKLGWFPSEEGERHAVFTVPKGRIRLPRPAVVNERARQRRSEAAKARGFGQAHKGSTKKTHEQL